MLFWSSFFKSLWPAWVGGWSRPILSVIICDVAWFKSNVIDVWIVRIRLCIEMNRSPSSKYIVCTLKQKYKIFGHNKFSICQAATEGSGEIFLLIIKKRATVKPLQFSRLVGYYLPFLFRSASTRACSFIWICSLSAADKIFVGSAFFGGSGS